MRLTGIFQKGKAVATTIRQVITYKEQESNKKRAAILQILIGLSLAVLGILLGYFFPLK